MPKLPSSVVGLLVVVVVRPMATMLLASLAAAGGFDGEVCKGERG